MHVTVALREFCLSKGWAEPGCPDTEIAAVVKAKLASREVTQATIDGLNASPRDRLKSVVAEVVGEQGGQRRRTPPQLLGGDVHAKRPSERYGVNRVKGLHVTSKMAVVNPFSGQEAEHLSGSQKAKCGAFWKFLGKRAGAKVAWTDHDSELLDELIQEDAWTGEAGGEYVESLAGGERVKALLDDSVSGGITLVPVIIDTDVVTTLLLYSELFPFVDVKDVAQGRRIETPSIGQPAVTFGTPEGTPMPMFDTTNFISALDSSIHPITASCEVGRDLLMNSPVQVGDVLQGVIGQAMLAALDLVIALGDGTTQALGITVTPGLTSVPSAGGTGTAPVMSDIESLIFSLPKQYRQAGLNPSFVGNDVTYRRLRTIPSAVDWNTRALGQNEQDYSLLGFPYRVQNNISNNKLAFACLRKYRMWRRSGFEPRWLVEGKDLGLRNVNLLIVRGLFGGRLVDASAAVLMSNLQS